MYETRSLIPTGGAVGGHGHVDDAERPVDRDRGGGEDRRQVPRRRWAAPCTATAESVAGARSRAAARRKPRPTATHTPHSSASTTITVAKPEVISTTLWDIARPP